MYLLPSYKPNENENTLIPLQKHYISSQWLSTLAGGAVKTAKLFQR
jgi:hypothetical protein